MDIYFIIGFGLINICLFVYMFVKWPTKLTTKIGLEVNKVTQISRELVSKGHELEVKGERKFAQVDTNINNVLNLMKEIGQELNKLVKALSNSSVRGAFGEKLAEDIIKKLGMVENIHYKRQMHNAAGKIPDFTFLLPNGIKMTMDSKFPAQNYFNFLNAKSEAEGKIYLDKFFKDVRDRVKEVLNKGYIDILDGTVDFALVFMPNDSIFHFLQAEDANLLDFCLNNKVVLVSPSTLYLVLSIVMQTHHIYNIDKNVIEDLQQIEKFKKEWVTYGDNLTKLLNTMQKHVDVTHNDTKKINKILTEV